MLPRPVIAVTPAAILALAPLPQLAKLAREFTSRGVYVFLPVAVNGALRSGWARDPSGRRMRAEVGP